MSQIFKQLFVTDSLVILDAELVKTVADHLTDNKIFNRRIKACNYFFTKTHSSSPTRIWPNTCMIASCVISNMSPSKFSYGLL